MTAPAPLVDAANIATYRGAPFESVLLDAACGAVRSHCGWHIAPRLDDHLVLVSGPAGRRLVLPTLNIVEVTAIRDVVTGVAVTGWRVGGAGMLIRDTGWPRGEDNLEVTLTHGYDTCPPEIVAVIVERARLLVTAPIPGTRSTNRTVGGVSTASSVTDSVVARVPAWSLAAAAILDRYTV